MAGGRLLEVAVWLEWLRQECKVRFKGIRLDRRHRRPHGSIGRRQCRPHGGDRRWRWRLQGAMESHPPGALRLDQGLLCVVVREQHGKEIPHPCH